MQELIQIDRIKVSKEFTESKPTQRKIDRYRNEVKQLKPIILDSNNTIVDGYIQYLILKERGVQWCWVEYLVDTDRKAYNTRMYVYGVHPSSPFRKEYKWRVPDNEKWDEFRRTIKYGDMIWCNTIHGVAPVIVTNIEVVCTDDIEVKGIKRVAKKSISRSWLWENIETDAKVLFKENIYDEWSHGYYAGLTYTKKPMVWENGATSWSTDLFCVPKYVRLANTIPQFIRLNYINEMDNITSRC